MSNGIETNESVKRILSYCNTWQDKSFLLEHKSWLGLSLKEAKEAKKNMRKYIKDSLGQNGKVSGVYIYISEDTKECLYIGKSKNNMYHRLFYHYLESVSREVDYKESKFNTSQLSRTFVDFFQNITRNLRVYIIEIENPIDILSVEQLLHSALNPKWIDFLADKQNKKKGQQNI